MNYEELEQWVESHERALLIVADTEEKAANYINVCLWLNVASIVLAVVALIVAVTS